MKYWLLLLPLFLVSFKGNYTEQQVLEKLQVHKWLVKQYSANGEVVEITESVQEMYWFKFHKDGSYTTMFEGDLATGTYTYNHKKSLIKMDYEPYGSDEVSLEFVTDTKIELGGNIYGKDGFMILEKE